MPWNNPGYFLYLYLCGINYRDFFFEAQSDFAVYVEWIVLR